MSNEPGSHPSAAHEAIQLANQLQTHQLRIVFAESCTCGMAVALMGQIPGISQWLCGSTVTYRESTKQNWLGVAAETLSRFTAESAETSLELAQGALENTNEADIAFSITGHLGPSAGEKDGQVFVAFADRFQHKKSQSFQLVADSRIERQLEAARRLLQFAIDTLENDTARR